MSDKSIIIRCDCHSPEHMFILDTWHWDTDCPRYSELTLNYSLTDGLGFWRRLRWAFLYLLGRRPGHSAWADTVIGADDAERMRDYLTNFLQSRIGDEV